MNERPILFKDEMIRAILEGRKTQTRRVVKPPKNVDPEHWMPEKLWDGQFNALHWPADHAEHEILKCPYGQPGDRLWVRETFTDEAGGIWPYLGDHISYRADPLQPFCERWTPSIHMPRWASRITLEITGVRVERLQDISEADAIAEGVEGHYIEDGWYWRDYLLTDEDAAISPMLTCPKESFRSLWQSINGPSSWNENPWVWLVEFKRVQP